MELDQRALAVETALEDILEREGWEGQHFEDTPRRVAKLWADFNHPDVDLGAILSTGFVETTDNMMVTQTNIPFKGLCAHHLVPFWGEAAIGYLPRDRIVGLSKLTRLVTAAGEREPSTQEAVTNLIVNTISHTLRPSGVAVITTAWHGCMAVRGPEAPKTQTTVSAMRGLFLHAPMTRQEFMDIVTMARSR